MEFGQKWSLIFFWKFMYVYGNWRKMKFVIFLIIHVPGSMEFGQKWSLIFFWKFMYAGLRKLAKNEVCDFFENSCMRVYGNCRKMKFDIFLIIHVPGSMEFGQKWSLWFFWKFMYACLRKLAKNEVWYFLDNSCARVYGNWRKMKFDIFLKIHVRRSTEIGEKWSLIFF